MDQTSLAADPAPVGTSPADATGAGSAPLAGDDIGLAVQDGDVDDQHAKGVDARVEAEQHGAIEPGSIMRDEEVVAVELARALLTSFGLDKTNDRAGLHELEGGAE